MRSRTVRKDDGSERDREKCTANTFSPRDVRGAMLKGSANGPTALPAVAGVFPR